MSTQRRAVRWQRRTSAKRAGVMEVFLSTLCARLFREGATDRTAPPHYAARLATNSLPMDIVFVSLAGRDVGRGSPPYMGVDSAGNSPASGYGSFLSLTSFPDGSMRFLLT